MKRTFNFTGRKRISRDDVSIIVREDGGDLVFDAELKLGEYRLPPDARVWIEAHRQNLWMQFAWGEVSALRPPPDRRLTEFDVCDGLLFRVRVVQPPGPERNKLLAEGDNLPFSRVGVESKARRPLLETVPDNLEDLVWKLDLDSEPPRLLINREARPTWRDAARSPHFVALVYPEVLRRLLTRILIEDGTYEDAEPGSWKDDWLRFGRMVGGGSSLEEGTSVEDRLEWIDQAVRGFARQHQLKTRLDLAFEEGTGS